MVGVGPVGKLLEGVFLQHSETVSGPSTCSCGVKDRFGLICCLAENDPLYIYDSHSMV